MIVIQSDGSVSVTDNLLGCEICVKISTDIYSLKEGFN